MTTCKFQHKILLALILILSLSPPFARWVMAEEEASLEHVVLTNTRDDLLCYFDVNGAFTKKIEEAVLNGVPTTFSFRILIYKKKDFWFDKEISELEISSTLKYNSLKKEFSVFRPWKTEKPDITESFEQAKAMMAEIDNLKIMSLSRLSKGKSYQLRLKAELSRVTLPLYLRYVLYFVSLWDFETDWYSIDFVF